MAKLINAAVAVLCTLAAVGGIPVEGETSQQLLAQAAKSTLGGVHANILDFTSKTLPASIDSVVSSIIDQEIQDKLGPIIEGQREDLAEDIRDNFPELVERKCYVLRDDETHEVVLKTYDTMTQCVNNGKQRLIQEVQQFRDQVPHTKTTIQEAVNEVNECRSQGILITNTTCVETKLPAIRAKLEELSRRAVVGSASVTARVRNILSEVESCTQSALSATLAELKTVDLRARRCLLSNYYLVPGGLELFLGIDHVPYRDEANLYTRL